jgi:hypothetical protein
VVAAGLFATDIFDEAFILELFENTVNRCLGDTAEFHAMKLALRDNGAGNDGTMETQNFASLHRPQFTIHKKCIFANRFIKT